MASKDSTPAVGTQTASSDESPIDYADLLARCDGDTAMMDRLVQKFQLKSTQMWAELLAGYQSGDAVATTRMAHGLKGTASNLSAVKVASLAARLEELGGPLI